MASKASVAPRPVQHRRNSPAMPAVTMLMFNPVQRSRYFCLSLLKHTFTFLLCSAGLAFSVVLYRGEIIYDVLSNDHSVRVLFEICTRGEEGKWEKRE